MSVPAWLLDIFAAVMLVVAAVSAARLAIAWRAAGPTRTLTSTSPTCSWAWPWPAP